MLTGRLRVHRDGLHDEEPSQPRVPVIGVSAAENRLGQYPAEVEDGGVDVRHTPHCAGPRRNGRYAPSA